MSMNYNLENLKEAYMFYKKALEDKNSIANGSFRDAEEWLMSELEALFSEVNK